MFEKILVVCDGNICRSPTAAFMLANKLGRVVESAGFVGLDGRDMDDSARKVAIERGQEFPVHVARKLTREMCSYADLILVMENKHLEKMRSLAPEATGKTMLLGQWSLKKEIPDPYKRDRETYKVVFSQIEEAVSQWANRL